MNRLRIEKRLFPFRKSWCVLLSASVLSVSTTTLSRVASAQQSTNPSAADISAARALGVEGVKLADGGSCTEAIPKLERSERLFHAPTTLGRLGECQVQTGKLVLGTENLQKVVREQFPSNPPPAFMTARARAQKVLTTALPRIAKLRISIKAPPDTRPSATVDGEPVSAALLDSDRPTDPGVHTVEATAPGHLSASTKVTLGEGATQTVNLVLDPDPTAPPSRVESTASVTPGASANRAENSNAPADSELTRSPEERSAGVTERQASKRNDPTLGYAFLGIGAAGILTGSVLGLMANGKKSSLDKACPNKQCPPGAQSDLDTGRALGTGSTIGFGVGLVGVSVGAVLLLVSPKSSNSATRGKAPHEPRVQPWVGMRSLGLSGSF